MNENSFFQNLFELSNISLVDANTFVLMEFPTMQNELVEQIINSSKLNNLHPSLLFTMMLMVQNSGLDNVFLIQTYSDIVDFKIKK